MLNPGELQGVVAALRQARTLEWPRLASIRSYMLNQADRDIYVPSEATSEYRLLVDQARFNVMPLVVTAVAQNLFVSGYRPTGESGRAPSMENSPIWGRVWQANRMDKRQSGLFRAAITYGYSYATVVPAQDPVTGESSAKVTPWSPLRLTALYDDPVNDEWPRFAMTIDRPELLDGIGSVHRDVMSVSGPVTVRVYDASHVYTLRIDAANDRIDSADVEVSEHGLGVTPVVRFVDTDDTDGCSLGKVEPLLPAQRQLNQTTFSLLMTQQYSAFRQRWATGMAIELDDQDRPKEPWNAAVNAVWQNESPDGRFGDFAESNLSGYLDSRDKTLLFIASTAQIPPHNLLVGSGISNVAADTLASIQAGHRRDIEEHETSFGESVEQTLRLAGLAIGDDAAWRDRSAQVVWRDTTPRSLGQIVDALGKMAAQLGLPVQALWERIPGVTDQDITRWMEMSEQQDVLAEIRRMLEDEPATDSDEEGVVDGAVTGSVSTDTLTPV